MLKRFFTWILSFFRRDRFNDSISGFVPKSVKRGSEKKPEVPKLVLPRAKKSCPQCDEPMFVSVGQVAFTHRFNSKGYPCRYASRHGGYASARFA